MSRHLAAAALAGVLAVLVAAPVSATPPANGQVTADLFGRIQEGPYYDQAGKPSWVPLNDVVQLRTTAGSVVGTARPNSYGEFRFAHVGVGTFVVALTYASLLDPVYAFRTYTRTLTWTGPKDSFQLLVDIDPYTNTPSYDVVIAYKRCPDAVRDGKGCNK